MSKKRFAAPKGMRDIMPADAAVFRHVEEVFRETCRLFAFREIRTPHLEATDLFCRTVGETTDIVEKEMYTLTTKGGDKLALRPENTAGVVRAYLEHGMHRTAPLQKFFYWGEMFRHESSQKKRYREFTQAGVESFGVEGAWADVEVIALAVEFFGKLDLGDVRVELSTFGSAESRKPFREALLAFFRESEEKLCPDCRRRLEKNVLRLLDCKEEACRALAREAPTIDPFLDDNSRRHFEEVQCGLGELKIGFELNPRLVRGLDYYTRTIFEIFPAGGSGRQDALGAGGRYDDLAELLGATKPVPAVGFALGIDRIVLELSEECAAAEKPDVVVVYLDEDGFVAAQRASEELRSAGIGTYASAPSMSLRGQMKYANRTGAGFVTVFGGDELTRGVAGLKNMATGEQQDVQLAGLAQEVRKALDAQEEDDE